MVGASRPAVLLTNGEPAAVRRPCPREHPYAATGLDKAKKQVSRCYTKMSHKKDWCRPHLAARSTCGPRALLEGAVRLGVARALYSVWLRVRPPLGGGFSVTLPALLTQPFVAANLSFAAALARVLRAPQPCRASTGRPRVCLCVWRPSP